MMNFVLFSINSENSRILALQGTAAGSGCFAAVDSAAAWLKSLGTV
jgi:hypothetical protein